MRGAESRTNWIPTNPETDISAHEWSKLLDTQLQNYKTLDASQSRHSYDHMINVPSDKSPFFSDIRTELLARICLEDYRSANIVTKKKGYLVARIQKIITGSKLLRNSKLQWDVRAGVGICVIMF